MHHESVSQTPNVIIFVFYAQVVMKSQAKNVTESDQVSVVPMVLAKNCLSRCQEGSHAMLLQKICKMFSLPVLFRNNKLTFHHPFIVAPETVVALADNCVPKSTFCKNEGVLDFSLRETCLYLFYSVCCALNFWLLFSSYSTFVPVKMTANIK